MKCIAIMSLRIENFLDGHVHLPLKLKIKKTSTLLSIDSIEPDGKEIVSGKEPVSVKVIARTSGGLNGNAKCYYRSGENWIEFFKTLENVHEQTFQTIYSGSMELPIKCEDEIGNIAERTARFSVRIDTQAPQVSRIYDSSGTLNIITNENAECFYSIDKNEQCAFNINNASSMSGNKILHTLLWEKKETHYIKCRDDFGNYAGECSAIVKGSF